MSERKERYETDLISVVAHDLKSPIGAVRGFLDLVENAGELNETQVRFLGRAFTALERMEGLIATMLKFAEVDGKPELDISDVDLRKVTDDTVMLLKSAAEARQITVSVESTPGKSSVPADEALMQQVIQNLVANAIKYNKDGGSVTMKITKQGPVMRVDVKDTGVGIPKEDLTRVFERFYRGRHALDPTQKGSGLGLAIVRAIVIMHDGDIWADSELDEGSTFSLTLPMHRRARNTDTEPRRRFDLLPSEQASEASDAVDDDGQESYDTNSDIESREDAPDGY